MTKLIYILLLLLPVLALGQKNEPTTEKYKYLKEEGYNGPTDWNADYPPTMRESSPSSVPYYPSGGNLSTEKLDEQRSYQNYGEGGTLPQDPEVKESESVELPEFDAPEIDAPDIDLPELDPPTLSENFWKMTLIIILTVLVILILYYFFKNLKPRDKKLTEKAIDLEWNPETISKSELELRLEKALLDKNYREGVRIYFTFILKELIRKNWIFWRNEKTNYDYLLEMSGKPSIQDFRQAVHIYDLVWYGEYEISDTVFAELQPKLSNYYQQLSKD
ncbi:MAG: hypothetical protein V4638_00275 [Bacteroidota bacterium]